MTRRLAKQTKRDSSWRPPWVLRGNPLQFYGEILRDSSPKWPRGPRNGQWWPKKGFWDFGLKQTPCEHQEIRSRSHFWLTMGIGQGTQWCLMSELRSLLMFDMVFMGFNENPITSLFFKVFVIWPEKNTRTPLNSSRSFSSLPLVIKNMFCNGKITPFIDDVSVSNLSFLVGLPMKHFPCLGWYSDYLKNYYHFFNQY